MSEAVLLKSGRDLGEEALIDSDDTVACESCHVIETDEAAYGNGWQLDPPVCPDCLRWSAVVVDEDCGTVSRPA